MMIKIFIFVFISSTPEPIAIKVRKAKVHVKLGVNSEKRGEPPVPTRSELDRVVTVSCIL
jgi:hypothetical protein